MSDPRYRGGVLQGIKLSTTPGDWPDELPDYGKRLGGQPFAHCALCPDDAPLASCTTFVRYGETPLCKRHALELTR